LDKKLPDVEPLDPHVPESVGSPYEGNGTVTITFNRTGNWPPPLNRIATTNSLHEVGARQPER